MKYFICTFLSIFYLSQFINAQQKVITCTQEMNSDRSISIYAESTSYADYTIKFTFPNLVGYQWRLPIINGVALLTVLHGKREVMKLVMEKTANMLSSAYTYQYFAGPYLRKPPSDTGFIYLLPGTASNVLRVGKVGSVEDRLGKKSENEHYATGFIYGAGDTICAARAGTVFECSDQVKEAEKGNQVFKSERNHVRIQQKDGTLAFYEIRSPIKLLVEAGDYVIPGQPIAVFNTESSLNQLIFSISYLDENKVMLEKNSLSNPNPVYHKSLPAHFCMDENGKSGILDIPNQTFKISHPKQLVAQELSKKEKKKWGANKIKFVHFHTR